MVSNLAFSKLLRRSIEKYNQRNDRRSYNKRLYFRTIKWPIAKNFDLFWCDVNNQKIILVAGNRLTLILSCSMNFQLYPHDTQQCAMKIESRKWSTFSMIFTVDTHCATCLISKDSWTAGPSRIYPGIFCYIHFPDIVYSWWHLPFSRNNSQSDWYFRISFFPVSHTTNDLVFEWESKTPLVVDDRIELPQLDLVNTVIGDCTQVYSTGKLKK